MGKRRKASVDESALPPEERERRRVQRERRALALRQRAAGTKYTPLRIARVQPWRKKEEGGVGWTGAIGEEGRVRAREKKVRLRARARARAHRLARAPSLPMKRTSSSLTDSSLMRPSTRPYSLTARPGGAGSGTVRWSSWR